MKNRFTFILLTIPLLICSCSEIKNDNAIHSPMSLDNEPIELTAKSVNYMINNDYTFSLFLYSSTCGLCENAVENIDRYTKESHYTFYKIEMFETAIEYLSDKQSNYFSSSLSYPLLYIFDKGELTYTMDGNTLNNYTNFTRIIRPQLIATNIFTVTKLQPFMDKYYNDEEFLLYTYDSSELNNKDIYNSHIYQRAIKSCKNLVIVDKYTAKSDLFYYILDNCTSSWFSLIHINQGEIKTTLGYDSASGDEINILLDSFFNVDSVNSSR